MKYHFVEPSFQNAEEHLFFRVVRHENGVDTTVLPFCDGWSAANRISRELNVNHWSVNA